MKQNDLLVAIHSVKSRMAKALREGNGSIYMSCMFDLRSLEVLAAEQGIELLSNEHKFDVLNTMLDNDEMWYIDPVTHNGTIYYDLPLLDC